MSYAQCEVCLSTSLPLNAEAQIWLAAHVPQLCAPMLMCWYAQVFGDDFIHGGRTYRSIPYVDPQELLEEPSIDPTIPFR